MPTICHPLRQPIEAKTITEATRLQKVWNDKLVKHEHPANAAEKGEPADIKQNTTNKGFFRGRRFG
jgi:hypothetical protein